MHFPWALMRMMDGAKVSRAEWPEGTWLALKKRGGFSNRDLAYLYIRFPDATVAPWTVNNFDLLADDWYDLVPVGMESKKGIEARNALSS
jgi:hypothetical protein